MSSIESEFAMVRSLVFEPYTVFRVRPMSGQYVNVGEAGFRAGAGENPWPPDANATNVFVFGGSTAFGYGVADGETIPSRLHERLLVLGKNARVYNFATANYTAVQERIRLEQLLLDGFVPRVAIFIDGFDEFISPYYEPILMKRLHDATKAQPLMERVARAIRPSTALDESECRLPDPATVLDRYLANVRLIKATCAEFGVRPLFVWQPVPCYRYPGDAQDHGAHEALIECVRSGYEMMRTRRTDDILWLADMQEGRTENLYLDPDHYTAAFSGDIASAIAQHLIECGSID